MISRDVMHISHVSTLRKTTEGKIYRTEERGHDRTHQSMASGVVSPPLAALSLPSRFINIAVPVSFFHLPNAAERCRTGGCCAGAAATGCDAAGVGSGAATPVAGGGMRNAGLFSELTLVEGGVIGDWTA